VSRAPSPEATIGRAILIAVLLLLQTTVAAQGASQYRECSNADRDAYLQALQQKLTSNWRVPSQYRDATCVVVIALSFTGEVLNAAAEDCGGDPKLAKSVEDASYLSSPLPKPNNSACFERQIRVTLRSKPD
jgi:membrane protein involved in colicin uptake